MDGSDPDHLLAEAVGLLRQKRRQMEPVTTTTAVEIWWMDRADAVLRRWDEQHPGEGD
jgi:hypothetical protein